jgi:hypothetical protein
MTLGNMRELGVERLVAHCLNPKCLHEGLVDVSECPDDTEVPSFASKIVCAICGRVVGISTCGQTATRKPDRQGLALIYLRRINLRHCTKGQ